MFRNDSLALGGEYRQKPNNLGALRADDAHDIFRAWFATQNFALTAAYVDLGNIATHADQRILVPRPAGQPLEVRQLFLPPAGVSAAGVKLNAAPFMQ